MNPATHQPLKPGATPPPATGFGFVPAMIPQGDGTMLVKPGKPVQRFTVRQCARIAHCSVWTIYRLYGAGFIQGERLSPRKIVIYTESLQRHLSASQDPEFWDHARRQAGGYFAARSKEKTRKPISPPTPATGLGSPGVADFKTDATLRLRCAAKATKSDAAPQARPPRKPVLKDAHG